MSFYFILLKEYGNKVIKAVSMGNLVQPTIKEAGQKAGNFLPDIQGPYLKKTLKAALFFSCYIFLVISFF